MKARTEEEQAALERTWIQAYAALHAQAELGKWFSRLTEAEAENAMLRAVVEAARALYMGITSDMWMVGSGELELVIVHDLRDALAALDAPDNSGLIAFAQFGAKDDEIIPRKAQP